MPKRRSRKSPLTPEDIEMMAEMIVDSTPVIGQSKAVYELANALKEEDWSTAALAGLGFIPAGGVAKQGIKQAAKRWDITGDIARQAERRVNNPSQTQLSGHNTAGVPTAPQYQRPNVDRLVKDFNEGRVSPVFAREMQNQGYDNVGQGMRELIGAVRDTPEQLNDLYSPELLRELSKYGRD